MRLGALVGLPSVMLGILVGVGGYTFYYAQGASYFSNDPKACVNCHVMRDQYDSWQKSSHHSFATCNDCHVPHDLVGKYVTKAENGYHHSRGFTFQNFHEPIRIKPRNAAVLNANCLHCHQAFVREITGHRVIHDEELYCVRCHDNVGHGSSR